MVVVHTVSGGNNNNNSNNNNNDDDDDDDDDYDDKNNNSILTTANCTKVLNTSSLLYAIPFHTTLQSLQEALRHGVYVHPDCSVAIATAITNVVRGRCRYRPAAGMEPRRLPAALLACVCVLAMAAGHPGGRPRGDFLSQRVANGSQRSAVKPTYTLSYRELYLEEACGGLANKAQRSHYLSLRDHKASMAIYSHRSGVLPRSVSKCRIQILTESHARLTISFVKLDTVEQPFICYMYLKIYMTDKPDLVCGKQATGKSISTSTSQMALEWVINNGGEKPGRIEMVLTSYKESDLSGNCESGMYACSNRHCIWSGFICDGVNNCGDGSDERLCRHPDTVRGRPQPRATWCRSRSEALMTCATP
nr:uncharacterized protein LOC126519190 isoform X3 [Dermacentor andersoni]